MLNPELSDLDRYPLKLGDLVILDCDPKLAPERVVWSSAREQVIEDLANPGFIGDRLHSPMRVLGDWLPYTGSLLSVDPAGGGSDELVALVTKVLNGQIFLLAGYATTKKPDEPEFEAVARLAAEHEVNMVLVEDNFGDGMFTQLLMPYLRRIYRSKDGRGCQVESIKNYGMTKEKRMLSALEPLMNAHKLCVSKDFVRWDRSSAPGNDYTLLFQMSRLQPIKGALIHDDRLDCLALAARYWNEQGVTATDSRERMIARAAERWDDDEITESTNWLDTFSL